MKESKLLPLTLVWGTSRKCLTMSIASSMLYFALRYSLNIIQCWSVCTFNIEPHVDLYELLWKEIKIAIDSRKIIPQE